MRPCDVILTLDIGWRQTLDKTYVVGGRETIKDKFFVDSKYRFQNVVLYYLILTSTNCQASNRLFYDNDFICNSNKDADTILIGIKTTT